MKSGSDVSSGPLPSTTLLTLEREVCADYGRSSRLEWLETNGAGGFAMGTVAGSNTRRYHGLLVASLRPPTDRMVTLSRLEETLLLETGEAPLATNQYPGTLYPCGYQTLEQFRLDPSPAWTFRVGDVRVERRVFLASGQQTVVVAYRCNRSARLRLRPLLALRDYHSLRHRADGFHPTVREEIRGDVRRVVIEPQAGLPALFLHHPGEAFHPASEWHDNVEYLEELDRGLDFREDLFSPGTFELAIAPGALGWVVATLDAEAKPDGSGVEALSATLAPEGTSSSAVGKLLRRSANQFIAQREDGSPTVLAGYPWFTDWGRDTMISLPGLLLTTGQHAKAQRVVEGCLSHLDGGLIPNRFPDRAGPAEYNTVDATLWMFEAVRALLDGGGERAFLADVFYPAARTIIEAHRRGTRHAIRTDPVDGLLVAGEPGSNLTWMDARVDGQPVTPRHGKPVEVNALWYNALRLMERWATELGEETEARLYGALAHRAAASFERTFWNPATGCLHDVILPDGPDARVRPNQLMALSLAYPLLAQPRRVALLHVVESQLLTPVGLRTLAPGEPGYQPFYRGGPAQRDAAYHQGLVWPWLLGPFVDAYLRVFGSTAETRHHCRALLRELEARLLVSGCLGSVSECFEAEPPYRPVGAPAQAWSVAELLRLRALLDEGPRG